MVLRIPLVRGSTKELSVETIRSNPRPANSLTIEMATSLYKRMSWEERKFFAQLEGSHINGLPLSRLAVLVRNGIIMSSLNPELTIVGLELQRIAHEAESLRDTQSNPLFGNPTPEQQARRDRDDRLRRETQERHDAATDSRPFYYEMKYPFRDMTITVLRKNAHLVNAPRITVKSETEARDMVTLLNRTFHDGFCQALTLLGGIAKEMEDMK